MATLQKIRNRAGLLIIVIGVALLAFIVGDRLTVRKSRQKTITNGCNSCKRLPKLMAIILQMSSACNSIISLPKSTSKALL